MTFYGHRVSSDIFGLENVVKQTGMLHSKNLIIDMLREIFAQDRQYRYSQDIFGFPKTPSHLGLDPDAGYDDEETTRIFIGSGYRYDIKFNPSIIVRNTGGNYVPISFNQDWMSTINRKEILMDGYGNQTAIYTPIYHTLVGAWDQTMQVRIITENEEDREEIADIVQVTLMGTRRSELQKAGIFIKRLSNGGETEQGYANDHVYMVDVNLDVRTEWRVSIPISNVCERIGLCLAFRTLDGNSSSVLSYNETITDSDLL